MAQSEQAQRSKRIEDLKRQLCDATSRAHRLERFVEWAIERAEEEESHVGGGMAQSFLRTLADDGKRLLEEGR